MELTITTDMSPNFTKPFRAQKRPYVVDVWEIAFKGKIPSWADGLVLWDVVYMTLGIQTIDGQASAREGDFLIKGIKGEIYPCRRDIFLETYEVVLDD